jgi:hypothetical protein
MSIERRRRRSPHPLQNLLKSVMRLFRRKSEPREPEDPYAYRMAQLRRPPRGRSGGAVAELDEDCRYVQEDAERYERSC